MPDERNTKLDKRLAALAKHYGGPGHTATAHIDPEYPNERLVVILDPLGVPTMKFMIDWKG